MLKLLSKRPHTPLTASSLVSSISTLVDAIASQGINTLSIVAAEHGTVVASQPNIVTMRAGGVPEEVTHL